MWFGTIRSSARFLTCGPIAFACLLVSPSHVQAQGAAQSGVPLTSTQKSDTRNAPRLYLGMWTTHLENDVIVLDNNQLVGFAMRGYFGATFLNSYGGRAFAGGLQRTLVGAEPRPIGASLGLRLGFITGYDERLMPLARKTPVLPLVQPFVTLDVYRVGLEVSYTFVVVSVATSFRF